MPLTVCKKCEKIFSSEMAACPYCGAFVSAPHSEQEKNSEATNIAVGLVVLALLVFILIIGNTEKAQPHAVLLHSCLISACPAGTKGVTSLSQDGPYYTCKSGELSDYANYVLTVMLAQNSFAGVSPKITSQTGEPDVPAKQQLIFDQYRTRAGVLSFEGALSKCYRGIGGKNVTVLDNPKQGDSIYVRADDNLKDQFWLPRAKLDKLP